MTINRRQLLTQCTSFTAIAFLNACATPGQTPMQNLATLVNDVALAYHGLEGELPLVQQNYPNLIPPDQQAAIENDLKTGDAVIAKIQANLTDPAMQSWLQQAEQDLYGVLTIANGLPIPPPYNLVIMAATVVLPQLEDYLNKQFGSQMRRAVTLRQRAAPTMTIVQARSILRTASAKRIRR